MDVFFVVNLVAALVAIVAMALTPPHGFKAIAIILGVGAVSFFLWAVSFSQSCVSDGCNGVVIPGMLCAACVGALVIGSLARWITKPLRHGREQATQDTSLP